MDFVRSDAPNKNAATIAARQTAATAAADNAQNPNKIAFELNISRGKGNVNILVFSKNLLKELFLY